jgi:hypothetical protein
MCFVAACRSKSSREAAQHYQYTRKEEYDALSFHYRIMDKSVQVILPYAKRVTLSL